MTQEDIISMAREAGGYTSPRYPDNLLMDVYDLERFTIFVAAAQREKVAAWMRSLGYATGHGDTIEALLDHLGTQIAEGLEAEVLMEREACAKILDSVDNYANPMTAADCAAAIRARSKV